MDAAVLTEPERLERRERERPVPDTDEVLVRVEACGVCTTDYHMYRGGLSVPLPVVPGHESAGEAVDAGDAVERVAVGDRLAINPSVPCGDCRHCVAGRENLCPDLTSLGGAATHVEDGSFAEYVPVPASNVEPVGDLPAARAAFAEPLGCCLHGLDRLDPRSGDSAAVVGAGPIGLLLVALFRLHGASPIVVSEPDDDRREHAIRMGADRVVDPTAEDPAAAIAAATPDDADGADHVVEAVGTTGTLEQARGLTATGGQTLVFGVPPEDATIDLSPFDVFYNERDVLGTYSLTPDSFRRAVTLLRNDRVDVDSLVTHEVGLDGITDAFGRMGANEGLKQMVYPGRDR